MPGAEHLLFSGASAGEGVTQTVMEGQEMGAAGFKSRSRRRENNPDYLPGESRPRVTAFFSDSLNLFFKDTLTLGGVGHCEDQSFRIEHSRQRNRDDAPALR